MKKRVLSFLICIAVCVLLFTACDSQGKSNVSQKGEKTVSDVLGNVADTQPSTGFDFYIPPAEEEQVSYPELDYQADCDLTSLGSNMVYSEVSNMMTSPDDYIGKTVKASGTMDIFIDKDTGNYYFACIIKDATACCTNGLEFILESGSRSPEDYPEVDTPITVGGVFETYEENGAIYCRLINAKVSAG